MDYEVIHVTTGTVIEFSDGEQYVVQEHGDLKLVHIDTWLAVQAIAEEFEALDVFVETLKAERAEINAGVFELLAELDAT